MVELAGALVDEHACTAVVAIGSSSAIDLGKAVADGRDVTLVLVPTALGGAEMSRGYGVLDGDRKAGARLRAPAAAVIYDPALLATLPARELGSIGINAWAHTIEAAYARTQHALGGAAALTAGRTLPDFSSAPPTSATWPCTARSSKPRTWPGSRSTRARWGCTTRSATSWAG